MRESTAKSRPHSRRMLLRLQERLRRERVQKDFYKKLAYFGLFLNKALADQEKRELKRAMDVVQSREQSDFLSLHSVPAQIADRRTRPVPIADDPIPTTLCCRHQFPLPSGFKAIKLVDGVPNVNLRAISLHGPPPRTILSVRSPTIWIVTGVTRGAGSEKSSSSRSRKPIELVHTQEETGTQIKAKTRTLEWSWGVRASRPVVCSRSTGPEKAERLRQLSLEDCARWKFEDEGWELVPDK